MTLFRTLSRNPTFASFQQRYQKTVGHKIRDFIDRVASALHPVAKHVFPNFIAVHYFYIISLTILASILIYPVKNFPYIDILFLAAGAATQGGLNTINLNELTLYQQIVVYITCLITTPIWIHSALAFVRLYWFERYFDGIKDWSKRNFKMRRTKTLMQRELTARTMTGNMPPGPKRYGPFARTTSNSDDFQSKLFSGKLFNRDEDGSDHTLDTAEVPSTKSYEMHNLSSKKKSQQQQRQYEDNLSGSSSLGSTKTGSEESPRSGGGNGGTIQFTDMPTPQKQKKSQGFGTANNKNGVTERFTSRRRSADINPADMYRSIAMLQDQHQEDGEDEGPALVIRGPAERRAGSGGAREEVASVAGTGRPQGSKEDGGSLYARRVPETQLPVISGSNDEQSASASTGAEQMQEQEQGQEQEQEKKKTHTHTHTNTPTKEKKEDESAGSSPAAYTLVELHDENMLPSPRPDGPSIHFNITKPPPSTKKRRTQDSFGPAEDKPKSTRRGSAKSSKRPMLFGRFSSTGSLRSRLRRIYTNEDEDVGNDADLEEDFADDSLSESSVDSAADVHSDSDSGNDSGNSNGTGNRSGDHKVGSEKHKQVEKLGLIHRAHSNLAVPSEDATDGLRFTKRSNTMDAATERDLQTLAKSPSFQKMIYQKWKREEREKRRKKFIRPKHRLRRVMSRQPISEDDGVESVHSDPPHSKLSHPLSQSNYDEEEGYYGLSFDDMNDRPRLNRSMSTNYLSWQPNVGRNSTFLGLTEAQKAELGGVEYRAIKLLCVLLLLYYFGFHIMSFVMLVPWINNMGNYKHIVRNEDGVSPTWWGFFTSMSAFNDLGLTLTPNSMISFNKAVYPLVTMMWFIVIGNTGFPILLRFIIWCLFKTAPDLSLTKESLGFLLDHPRRCFTLLFPSAPTWWLLLILVALNVTDLVLFVILDLNATVLDGLSHGFKVLDGLFQAVSTRTAGFSVLDLSQLHPSVQVSYMLMMYVSVLPLAISIRRTNVYEEQSLGVYGGSNGNGSDDQDMDPEDLKKMENSTKSFIGAHLRKQLSFDLWFVFLGLFVICICEGGKIQDTKRPAFTVFQVLFEVVSAYGTVGLSLGYPSTNQSFSAQFTTLSKLVMIAMLIRGRHRGLPYSLDRAIILPSEKMKQRDRLADLKLQRNKTSTTDPVLHYLKKRTKSVRSGITSALGRSSTSRNHNQQEDHMPFLNSQQTGHSRYTQDPEVETVTSSAAFKEQYNLHDAHKKGGCDDSGGGGNTRLGHGPGAGEVSPTNSAEEASRVQYMQSDEGDDRESSIAEDEINNPHTRSELNPRAYMLPLPAESDSHHTL